jgi:hypothetical protein
MHMKSCIERAQRILRNHIWSCGALWADRTSRKLSIRSKDQWNQLSQIRSGPRTEWWITCGLHYGGQLSIHRYAFLALAALILTSLGVRFIGDPILPFAAILATGEILIAFQLEDHRLGRMLTIIAHGLREDHTERISDLPPASERVRPTLDSTPIAFTQSRA